ncbi:hypothetical protein CPR19088_GLDEOEPO_00797 [Companilactobacillus paralimentarius]
MVAKEAVSLSKEYHEQLYQAGLLHDISAFIPKSERLLISEKLHIPVLKEEHQVPLLLHQKLSAYIAEKCFQIKDPIILNAIKCHTTLKKNFNNFDLIVFLADKIAWDQPGIPPYLEELNTALKVSYRSRYSFSYYTTGRVLKFAYFAKFKIEIGDRSLAPIGPHSDLNFLLLEAAYYYLHSIFNFQLLVNCVYKMLDYQDQRFVLKTCRFLSYQLP